MCVNLPPHLCKQHPVALSELAKHSHCVRSNITQLVDRLERRREPFCWNHRSYMDCPWQHRAGLSGTVSEPHRKLNSAERGRATRD